MKKKYIIFALPVVLQLVFWFLLHQIPARYDIWCILDDYIPFCKYFVVLYISWFLLYIGTLVYFFKYSKNDFIYSCLHLTLGYIICLFIFFFFQNQITFRPTLEGNDIFTILLSLIYKSGNTACACPSLHCYVSGVLLISILKYSKNKRNKVLFTILVALIWLSTVFTKQHSIIDAGGALILLFITYNLIYKVLNKNIDKVIENY